LKTHGAGNFEEEVDWDKEELHITETSVKNKADWADMEKREDRF
jgi:hypothetical protein